MKVPFLDLKAQYNSIKDEVLPEIHNVLDNTAYVMGKPVFNFEENFAKEHNAKHCVALKFRYRWKSCCTLGFRYWTR